MSLTTTVAVEYKEGAAACGGNQDSGSRRSRVLTGGSVVAVPPRVSRQVSDVVPEGQAPLSTRPTCCFERISMQSRVET